MKYCEKFEAADTASRKEMEDGNKVAEEAWHILQSGIDNANDTYYEKKNTDEAFDHEDEEFWRIAYDSAAGLAVSPGMCSDEARAWLEAHDIIG